MREAQPKLEIIYRGNEVLSKVYDTCFTGNFRIESCLVALASEAIFHSYLMNFTILSVEYLGCSWKQEMHPQFQVISPSAESGLGWMMSTAQHCKNIKLNEILILHIICTFAFYSSKKNVTCAKEMSKV